MKLTMHIFDPLMSLFKVDYEKRLSNLLQYDLYEARKRYIAAVQAKQQFDTELAHAENRVNTLTELLIKQKEVENGKISFSPTINVVSTYSSSNRPGI